MLAFNDQVINDNLYLSVLRLDDAATIFKCVEQNRDLLSKYLYWVETVTDVASCRQYIDDRANSDSPNKQWFKVVSREEVSGIFAIKSIDENGLAEVGYWLSAAVHGIGIIGSIIKKLVNQADIMGISCIEFRCLTSNLASIRAATKCGAIKEDIVADFLTIDGQSQDLAIYRLRLFPSHP